MHEADAPGADLRMVLFNADGSEAEISGNGIRCLGQAALRAGGRRDGRIVIDSGAGRRTLDATATTAPDTDLLRVEMGELGTGPEPGPAAVAMGALHVGSGAVGNPHIVLHLVSLEGVDPSVDGPLIEGYVLPLDDGLPCTGEACSAGVPIHPAKPDGMSCNDGDACTLADTCQAGLCVSNTPVVCGGNTLCVNGACAACTNQFLGPKPVQVGVIPTAATTADFDGDGKIGRAHV